MGAEKTLFYWPREDFPDFYCGKFKELLTAFESGDILIRKFTDGRGAGGRSFSSLALYVLSIRLRNIFTKMKFGTIEFSAPDDFFSFSSPIFLRLSKNFDNLTKFNNSLFIIGKNENFPTLINGSTCQSVRKSCFWQLSRASRAEPRLNEPLFVTFALFEKNK